VKGSTHGAMQEIESFSAFPRIPVCVDHQEPSRRPMKRVAHFLMLIAQGHGETRTLLHSLEVVQ